MKVTDSVFQTLQSIRPKVEEMLIRNGFVIGEYCPSQHHRCGQFIDANAEKVRAALSAAPGERVQFRKSQLARDLALAHTFRKIWEVCQLVQAFNRGEEVDKSAWACGPFQR